MEPPRMLHACMLYQGGVLVTGGKVRPGKVAKERDYIIGQCSGGWKHWGRTACRLCRDSAAELQHRKVVAIVCQKPWEQNSFTHQVALSWRIWINQEASTFSSSEIVQRQLQSFTPLFQVGAVSTVIGGESVMFSNVFNNCFVLQLYYIYIWKSCACISYHRAVISPRKYAAISVIKKLQYNFPKMKGGGGVKGRLDFFQKIIWSGSRTLPL